MTTLKDLLKVVSEYQPIIIEMVEIDADDDFTGTDDVIFKGTKKDFVLDKNYLVDCIFTDKNELNINVLPAIINN